MVPLVSWKCLGLIFGFSDARKRSHSTGRAPLELIRAEILYPIRSSKDRDIVHESAEQVWPQKPGRVPKGQPKMQALGTSYAAPC
jgi:hypothetical protein